MPRHRHTRQRPSRGRGGAFHTALREARGGRARRRASKAMTPFDRPLYVPQAGFRAVPVDIVNGGYYWIVIFVGIFHGVDMCHAPAAGPIGPDATTNMFTSDRPTIGSACSSRLLSRPRCRRPARPARPRRRCAISAAVVGGCVAPSHARRAHGNDQSLASGQPARGEAVFVNSWQYAPLGLGGHGARIFPPKSGSRLHALRNRVRWSR